MHLHQVLTGAVNPGDSCYSVGSVNDIPFTAYGSGCDIVILASDFECVQIIPGAKHGNIQVSCVECSHQLGRIAASYGNTVCIFEPVATNPHKRNNQLNYQWQKTGQFFLNSMTYNLAWDPQGNRILTATDQLQLWAPPSGDILLEEDDSQAADGRLPPVLNDWKYVWQCKTAVSVHIMKWSSDGEYFATAGKDGVCRLWSETLLPEDSLLGGQITESSTSSSSSLPHLGNQKDKIQHALETIHHFKHLRRGRRRSSALVAHTDLLPSQLGSHDVHRQISHHANALCHFHIAASISPSTELEDVSDKGSSEHEEGEQEGSPKASSPGSSASVPLPTVLLDRKMEALVNEWNRNPDMLFTIHPVDGSFLVWHVKYLDEYIPGIFRQVQVAFSSRIPVAFPTGDANSLSKNIMVYACTFTEKDSKLEDVSDKGSSEHEEGEQEGSPKASSPGSSASVPLPTVLLDRKMEALVNEWNRNPDMLFTIHPVDGSFLVWHVKYLDEYIPGIFRQVQVAFSSRIPVAFPTGDANSLSKNIMVYACTFTEKDSSDSGQQKKKIKSIPHSASETDVLGSGTGHSVVPVISPAVMMVSKHIDGSLNQWAVTFADKSTFSSVLTVSHKFRYCGHRFHLNDLACHTVLPLLLTSSHHNALLTPESENERDSEKVKQKLQPFKPQKGFSRKQLKNAATRTFHDPNAIYSELILWRVDHIGPLSCTGGVSELARINSLHTSAFSNVAWLPTLIPSHCLGTYCNSASACFVASDGKNLRLYQAVVDARKLLDELSDPEISKLVGEAFNIVSQQSTARPGCIIELDVITNQCGSTTQLLHVFQEDFILGYKPQDETEAYEDLESSSFQPEQGYRPPLFSETFFLVVIAKDSNRRSVLQMWHLHLKSVQACSSNTTPEQTFENKLTVPQQNNAESSPDSSPGQSPLPRSSSTANLQSASKLILSSKLVYSQPLDLPNDVEVIRATPSAGHLSSSSIYPICLAPYLIVTTCSDSKIRFWHCIVEIDPSYEDPEEGRTYRWEPWSLMNEEDDSNSAVCVPGRPVAVSCSYTGRLAVAFKQLKQSNGCISKEFSMHVSIFECESTGGSEWVLEQTIHLDDLANVGNALDPRVSVDSNLCVYSKSDLYLNKDHHLTPNIKHFVHLDWLSKEDGSHILTVGVGSSILMYGRISGIVNEQTSSKDGVAVITLPLGGSIKQGIKSKWILLRSVDLVSSVDGTPSLPVSLSWVRDGILVIGMDCEMHVYAQWKQDKKRSGETESDSPSSSENIAGQVDSRGFDTKACAMKHSVFDGPATAGDAFAAPTVLQDGGLFEAAHSLSPTLPQYHPTQLLELMDLGKVRRAKAILSHLVKCIAGEVAIVRDTEAGEGGARRHLSRTISVSGSTAKDTIIAGRDGVRDYTEIDSIPPLPLYALLSADLDTSYKIADESGKVRKGSESQRKLSGDQYEDLFQVQAVTTDDFVSFATEKRESKSRVINLSQYGLTYFGPEHARVLSSHLMHSSLPGLTRLEQMFLVALADTVATTSTEVGGSREKSCTGGETIDECGLRYLLAMRLHTCLLTSLPPLYRLQLLHQGVSTCHFAWAFHSEAEDEMLNMIPAMQRGDPQWPELRAMGVGWSQHDDKMTQFFSHNFNEDRWRKAALKNAFSLLGKQRFEQAAAFFLLAGSLKDAIEVCLEKMEDIQLAMVVSRLYESDYETSPSYKGILNERVLGCLKDGTGFICSKLHPDPFLRSMSFWIMKDYTRALDTLLEQIPKEDDENPAVIVKSCNPVVFSFYNYLRTHPLLIRRHFASPEGSLATVGLTAEKRTYCNSASACFVASDGKNLRLYQAVVDARKLLDELSDPEISVAFSSRIPVAFPTGDANSLRTYCNSASACFVASDGKNLRLYQAVVDARKLLDELSDPEISKLVGEVFNIVSQQSTARPGCIIELDVITNQCGSTTQLLHVFQEDFILGYKPHDESEAYEDLESSSFQTEQGNTTPEQTFENKLTVPQQNNAESSPDSSPGQSPLPRSSSTANLQSASKLILSSKLVYSQPLDLPNDVEVIRATPSAELEDVSDKGSSEHEEGEQEGSPKASSPGSSASVPLPTVLLDRKMEALVNEWNRNPDMLFTIHPVDGSFLVWHVKYLDEYIPGIFRQVQVLYDIFMAD
ncbi:DmX-like protein 2 [Acipenser ruthenus]|uniref:DmX-like protein 2 n=1 Tax=Acipenser ruthenus TaxID=7906 RepID=A0A444V589_ACIRT|nr:DmX-like protein 2 [Acipenser ruthenus]